LAGSNNFLQWNPSKNNQEDDSAWSADTLRVNGAPPSSGTLCPSIMDNKFRYQVSTFVSAFGQMLSAKGYTVSDAAISSLVTTLSNVLTNYDAGTTATSGKVAKWDTNGRLSSQPGGSGNQAIVWSDTHPLPVGFKVPQWDGVGRLNSQPGGSSYNPIVWSDSATLATGGKVPQWDGNGRLNSQPGGSSYNPIVWSDIDGEPTPSGKVPIFGLGQTRHTLTTSRFASVVYTNTTGKPIMVIIILNVGGGQSSLFTIGPAFNYPIGNVGTSTTQINHSYIILPNETYELTLSGSSIASWVEIR